MPKISVLLPTYNHEKYIVSTIESLLKQSESDIEILAVDDGSTDRTFQILKLYQQKDSRLKIYQKKNGGVVSALNVALEKATGEWIASCGSDDIVPKHAYRFLLNNSQNVDIVIGNFCEIDDDGKFSFVRLNKKANNNSCFNALFSMPAMWNKIIRRELICTNRLQFRNVKICEDLIFLAELAATRPRYKTINRSVYWYRNNDKIGSSMTHNYTIEFFEAHIKGRTEVEKICDRAGILEAKKYVYKQSLLYLATFLFNLPTEDIPSAFMVLKNFVEGNQQYLDDRQFRNLFLLSPTNFINSTKEDYQSLLSSIGDEDRILQKLQTGRLGFSFILKCMLNWIEYKIKG